MNGPDHYREAERLLRISDQCQPSDALDRTVTTALVHATLALAAATALAGTIDNTMGASHPINQTAHDDETIRAVNDWHEVAARNIGGGS